MNCYVYSIEDPRYGKPSGPVVQDPCCKFWILNWEGGRVYYRAFWAKWSLDQLETVIYWYRNRTSGIFDVNEKFHHLERFGVFLSHSTTLDFELNYELYLPFFSIRPCWSRYSSWPNRPTSLLNTLAHTLAQTFPAYKYLNLQRRVYSVRCWKENFNLPWQKFRQKISTLEIPKVLVRACQLTKQHDY